MTNRHDLLQQLLPNSTISGAALPNTGIEFHKIAIKQKNFGIKIHIY
jgi:hypothetical protein